jgi:kynureninase
VSALDYAALDRADPLAPLRQRFILPDDRVYFDGNSLGALPATVPARLARTLETEWGRDLIASWNSHAWIDLPQRVGAQLAPLLGAASDEVLCTDSISVNLFKLLAAALDLRPGRRVVLTQQDNFPTDLYVAQGLADLLGGERCTIRSVPAAELVQCLDHEVAILMLTHVNFRTGVMHDMRELTRRAHQQGALVLWDLAHSAGAMPLDLDGCEVDMAVGCGYKFLNGGPGAPAFLYLARRHQERAAQPLSGWMGHARAFDFSPDYQPAAGIARYLSGTPGILGMSALSAALEVFDGVDMTAIRAKSCALGDSFIAGLETETVLQTLQLVSPREAVWRGSQVSLRHPCAYAITQALIAAGIIVDFRAPDIIRFGFSPLYNRFVDVERALAELAVIMAERRFEDPDFARPRKVT